MSDSKFGFLPYVRKGLVKNILLEDDISYIGTTAPDERAEIDIEVKLDTPTSSIPINKTIKLVGPGDVLSVSRDVILRTEPMNYVFNFEYNLLPFIEFYEEDFLWRYSPAKDKNKKLRPWLALIILKDDEFNLLPPAKEGLPARIEVEVGSGDINKFLHLNEEHWAWGHVQMNKPATTNAVQDLKNTIDENPDLAMGRLMSSRKLEEDTEYTAFLIPSFETGRLAGLGQVDLSGISSLEGAWNHSSVYTNTAPLSPEEFPIYHQWRFGTSALGDFEHLARKLDPIELDDDQGLRLLDMNKIGMGVDLEAAAANVPNSLYPTETDKDGTVNLEGALKPAGATYDVSQNLTPTITNPLQDTFTEELKKVLNLQTELQLAPNSATNVYQLGSNDEDPVILPPLYGQHHADEEKLDTGVPLWFQEANLDVRNRAAAGMGVQVVKDKQEQFMEMAWSQVGEINAANEKIRKAQLAMEASRAIYEKHLVGANETSAFPVDMKFERVLKLASPAMKKIKDSTAPIVGNVNTYYGLTGGNAISSASSKTITGVTALTSATTNSGFRKISRNRSTKIRVADKGTNSFQTTLEANLDADTSVTAAEGISPPKTSVSFATFIGAGTTAHANYYANTLPTVSYDPINYTSGSDWLGFLKSQFVDFEKTYNKYNVLNGKDIPPRISLIGTAQADNFRVVVMTSLDPEVSIQKRVEKQFNFSSSTTINFSSMSPILAHPVINIPMVNELVNLSEQNLIPNLGDIPNNAVTLMESNDRFIESFMLGINHEFNRELLWREFPTDLRGTSFKVFWDKKDDLSGGDIEDIKSIHNWQDPLGENDASTSSQSILVLTVRGDLLKKFPNALVYAQKGKFDVDANNNSIRTLDSLDYNLLIDTNTSSPTYGNSISSELLTPRFKMNIQPDIVTLGFEIDKADVLGDPNPQNGDAGWFFVFRERPGSIRFGLDIPGNFTPPLTSWDDLDWDHMASADYASMTPSSDVSAMNALQVNPGDYKWSEDAAQTAAILYQTPSMIAIHASNMIN